MGGWEDAHQYCLSSQGPAVGCRRWQSQASLCSLKPHVLVRTGGKQTGRSAVLRRFGLRTPSYSWKLRAPQTSVYLSYVHWRKGVNRHFLILPWNSTRGICMKTDCNVESEIISMNFPCSDILYLPCSLNGSFAYSLFCKVVHRLFGKWFMDLCSSSKCWHISLYNILHIHNHIC